MQKPYLQNRRNVLAMGATMGATALAGCSSVIGGGDDTVENPPDPEISEVSSDVENFRQTDDLSTTLFLIENNGGEGELRLEGQAVGDVAIYDDDEQKFSLKEDQSIQARFEFFTHEGAQEIQIRIEATADPTNYYDERTISEDETPDLIDY